MSELIISNNKISSLRNNGKTIAALFSEKSVADFFQLSLHNDIYDLDLGSNYIDLSISGLKIPTSIDVTGELKIKDLQCRTGQDLKFNAKSAKTSFIKRKNIFTSLARDLIYLYSFVSGFLKLLNFIKTRNIKRIFFVYPDFLFLQIFVFLIAKLSKVRLDIYITDDYLLDFDPVSGSVRVRSGYSYFLHHFFKCLAKQSTKVFCISTKMSIVYKNKFGIETDVLINSTMVNSSDDSFVHNDNIIISYFGSLHSGRFESLHSLCLKVNAIKSINISLPFQIVVYSDKNKECADLEKQFQFLTFKESLSGDAYSEAVKNSDFLVLLEGLDIDSIKSTWLSCSTKVPEYLSARKPIIMYGSKLNGSIDFLLKNNLGIFVDDCSTLLNLFQKENDFSHMTNQSYDFYQNNFSSYEMQRRLNDESFQK